MCYLNSPPQCLLELQTAEARRNNPQSILDVQPVLELLSVVNLDAMVWFMTMSCHLLPPDGVILAGTFVKSLMEAAGLAAAAWGVRRA